MAQRGFERPFLNFFEVVFDGETACGAALGEGVMFFVGDVASSEIFAGTPGRDVMLDAGALAVLSLPLLGSLKRRPARC